MPDRPNVLVVDDNALVRRMLSKALESEGYVVSGAGNGLEGLEQVSKQDFGVVVSDMDMPEMGGLELIAGIKEREPDLPIVVVSGNDQLSTVIEAMKRGASDYIIKDEDAQTTVVLAVQKALEKYELAMQNRLLTEQLQARNDELEQLNQENVRLVQRLTQFNEELEERVAEATEQIQRRLTETRALNRVASAISSVMDLEPLLALIMDAGKEVMDAERDLLMLVDDETQQLYVPGDATDGGGGLRVEIGDGIPGWVARSGQPLRIDDAYNDPRFDPARDEAPDFRSRSVLCVPLMIQEDVRGIVQVVRSEAKPLFSEEEIETLVSFSHHAAIAIENARLYEQTKRQAEELHSSLEQNRWLQLQRDKLGKYVPQSVVEDIERNREKALAATTKIVESTILFADIEGFTRMSESASATTLVEMLNKYHSITNAAIEKNGGVLDKFIGDGTMAVFLPKENEEDHPLRAVRCAIEMQCGVESLAPEWREAGLGDLNVRIGVNLGNVISGSIGAETRMDYTVVGDAVNVASRLEGSGQVGQVLISELVYERVKHEVSADRLEPLYVKNRVQPVQPYSIRVLDTAPRAGEKPVPEVVPAVESKAPAEEPVASWPPVPEESPAEPVAAPIDETTEVDQEPPVSAEADEAVAAPPENGEPEKAAKPRPAPALDLPPATRSALHTRNSR